MQNFINHAIGQRPLEKLPRLFAVAATDLQSGEAMVFRTGNTGMVVLEGEKAVAAALPEIKAKLAKLREGR